MSLYKTDLTAVNMAGETVKFSDYSRKVLLIVNTSNDCGHTSQFKGLENLYQEYEEEGFIILGFPCNQFKNQDSGTNEEILAFTREKYGVTFPMFQKIEVNGEGRHPLYQYLIDNNESKNNKDIKSEFAKFLVNRKGHVVKRYASRIKPKNMSKDVAAQL